MTRRPAKAEAPRPRPRPARLEGYARLLADLKRSGDADTATPAWWPSADRPDEGVDRPEPIAEPEARTDDRAEARTAPVAPSAAPVPRRRSTVSNGSVPAPKRTPAPQDREAASVSEPPAPPRRAESWVSRWEAAVEDGCEEEERLAVLEHCREQAYVHGDIAWRAALTLLLARSGKADEARRELAATEAAVAEKAPTAAWIDVPAALGRARRLLGSGPEPAPKPRKAGRLRALSSPDPAPMALPGPVEPRVRARLGREAWTSWEEPA